MTNNGRQKALDTTLATLNKRYGEGIIMKLGEATRLDVAAIPTGSLSLDIALGVGGIPRGRIIEVYGPESSGKTTLCLHAIAESQRQGGVCGFVDVEHALDPSYARKIGVDVENLYISQPDTGEQALEIAEALVRSGAMDVVVVDSVAALVPRAEIEGEMGDSHMGLAGAADEPGVAQAGGCGEDDRHEPGLHQPVAAEDRRDVWQSGDDVGRYGVEVLCQCADGYTADTVDQTGE